MVARTCEWHIVLDVRLTFVYVQTLGLAGMVTALVVWKRNRCSSGEILLLRDTLEAAISAQFGAQGVRR